MGEVAAGAGRVLFADVKPYDTPGALAALRGPAAGVVELPLSVCWGPRRVFDLSRPGHVRTAYQALIRDGRLVDQQALLNAEVLRAVWSTLLLPVRVRALWEAQLPELGPDRR